MIVIPLVLDMLYVSLQTLETKLNQTTQSSGLLKCSD